MIRAQTKAVPELLPDPDRAEAVHDARLLTRGGATAQIALDGKLYTLRITRAGKLILTK